ncbi:MAG: hypothetical protein EBT04_13205 [Betaproteobacteria bacterium]|nr:hypothetical protein [Betaproteobacteria bacterium]
MSHYDSMTPEQASKALLTEERLNNLLTNLPHAFSVDETMNHLRVGLSSELDLMEKALRFAPVLGIADKDNKTKIATAPAYPDSKNPMRVLLTSSPQAARRYMVERVFKDEVTKLARQSRVNIWVKVRQTPRLRAVLRDATGFHDVGVQFNWTRSRRYMPYGRVSTHIQFRTLSANAARDFAPLIAMQEIMKDPIEGDLMGEQAIDALEVLIRNGDMQASIEKRSRRARPLQLDKLPTSFTKTFGQRRGEWRVPSSFSLSEIWLTDAVLQLYHRMKSLVPGRSYGLNQTPHNRLLTSAIDMIHSTVRQTGKNDYRPLLATMRSLHPYVEDHLAACRNLGESNMPSDQKKAA